MFVGLCDCVFVCSFVGATVKGVCVCAIVYLRAYLYVFVSVLL